MLKEPPKNSREKTKNLLLTLQDKICSGLEKVDGQGKFTEESWLRAEGGRLLLDQAKARQARQAQARPSQGWAQQASQPSQSSFEGPKGSPPYISPIIQTPVYKTPV